MYDAAVNWIAVNAAGVATTALGFVGSVLLTPAIGALVAPLMSAVLSGRVSLRRAGVTVGRVELEAGLRQHIVEYEQEEFGGRQITDPATRQLLNEYALSDDEVFDFDSVARRAGLSSSAARRAWKEHEGLLLTDDDRRIVPGLRSYVRAQLLLERDDRAGAR